jgi:alpha-L-fucosidase
MNRAAFFLVAAVGLGLPVVPLHAQPAAAAADAVPEAVAKWRDLRFGMFVHWGPVAIKGTEIGWSRGAQVPTDVYDKLYTQFNPEQFDADAWAKTAADAGMKYLVLTTKHHDGFCLWPSKAADYHIGNSPFKRDVVKELAAACKKHGVRFGTYYSICDWHHPDYPLDSPGGGKKKAQSDMPRYVEVLKAQTRELIENYGPLVTMWFDGEWEQPWTREMGNDLYAYLKKLQPDLVINNRVSTGRQGMEGVTKDAHLNAGDYDTPEQKVGGFNRARPWETCMTICQQWAWKPNDAMKSREECLRTLLRTVGGDGNLLFNVGPMPDGRIEPRQVERLREMGAWLKKAGDGVYGARGGPFKPGRWGASTCKGDRIFLYVMDWPAEGPLRLPAIGRKVTAHRTLTGGTAALEQGPDGLALSLPGADRDPVASVIELTVEGKAFDIPPAAVGSTGASLASGRPATASNVYQKSGEHGPDKAVDDDPETRWATDAGTKAAWLEVDLGVAASVGRVAIDECVDFGQRVKRFEIQVRAAAGDSWKTVLEGTTIGKGFAKAFPSVPARFVRLAILDASDGPTIREFSVFKP